MDKDADKNIIWDIQPASRDDDARTHRYRTSYTTGILRRTAAASAMQCDN